MKTFVATAENRQRDWLVVDAEGQTLGRLATQIADALRGKRKPTYTPHVDTGDFVVVVNAEKIRVTGDKLAQKTYWRHSGYPGGIKSRSLAEMLEQPSPNSMFWSGYGGSLSLIDMDAKTSFAFTMNKMGATTFGDERSRAMARAMWRALGI